MRIRLDDQEGLGLISNPSTLAGALAEVTELVQAKGRAIQTIIINAENVAPEALTVELGSRPVSEIDSLELQTVSIKELVVESLDEIAEVIPELPTACHELAQVLVSDDPASCFAQFNQFLEIWEVLKERQAQAASSLELSLEELVFRGSNASAHNLKLDAMLKKARGFMEASSFPELSDLLSHDLVELAEAEADLIAALRA
ncbi:MAG: hypothetical protein VCD00_11720 [Candidatus Hydrogenedentota bacterium]